MAEEKKIYEGTIGLPIILDLEVDLSTAASPTIEVTRRDGSVDSLAAEVYQGTKLRYVTQLAADLPAGALIMQGKPNLSGGPAGLSNTKTHKIWEKGK